MSESLERRLERLELLYEVGIALSAEDDKDRLVERILLEAKKLCNADGGTLYLRTEDDQLRFAIMRTDSLGIALGGTTGKPIEFAPLPMFAKSGAPNEHNIATCAALRKESFNIPDAYDATGFDFSDDEDDGPWTVDLILVKGEISAWQLEVLTSAEAAESETLPAQ